MKSTYNSTIRIIANNQDNDYFNPSNIIMEEPSIGTGFFIDKNIIITCAHVIESAQTIYFNIPSISSNRHKAKIQGICPSLDLAILQSIDFESKYFLDLHNSDNINLQEQITVVGFPLGSDKLKVTKGIISGSQDGYIQIDSAINSGNSGGPLLNTEQKVIGIISSKVINADNIGYAIPINLLSIFKSNSVNKVYHSCNLLAKFSNTSEFRINQLNEINIEKHNKIISGQTVSKMSKMSPLKTIDINPFDLIIEIDNKVISNYGEITTISGNGIKMNFTDYIERLIPGIEYQIKFFSIKERKIISAKIIFPTENNIGVKKILPAFDQLNYINVGGLILTPLTINAMETNNKIALRLRKYSSYVERFCPKVFVANIDPSSSFRLSENINAGDVINKINGKEILTLDDVLEIIDKTTNNKYITIETKNNKIDTISTDCIKNIDSIKTI